MSITIRKNDYDEYEVPTAFSRFAGRVPTAIYYTDDKEDAEGTCRYHFGDEVKIRFTKGSYEND